MPIDCLHIVLNSVTHDSRVLKTTCSLVSMEMVKNVEIAGLLSDDDEQTSLLSQYRAIRRFDLLTRSWPKNLLVQFIKYAEFYFRMVIRYRREPLSVVHAHDLSALPMGVRLAKATGARLIYDSHELQSETKHAGGVRKVLSRWLESLLIRRVDVMITVSPSILDWYHRRYPSVPIHMVRNVPEKPCVDGLKPVPLRDQFSVPDDALLFIYLGGISSGRGIHNALNAFLDGEVRHHILFMGSGPLELDVKAAAESCPRVHYLPPVLPSEVLRNAAGADVGVSLIEDSCLNYRYCLPNKLFESLLAGLPVLASNLPDQAAIVERYQAGWVIENTAEAIAHRLRTLSVEEAHTLRRDLPNRVADLSWENETRELGLIYDRLVQIHD